MTNTMRSRKTLTALGCMDGNYLQAMTKLKRINAWSLKHDPATEEKTNNLMVNLTSKKSIISALTSSYRDFDFDQQPEILQAIAAAEEICSEAQNLPIPKGMQIAELKNSLTARASEIPRWASVENDPVYQSIRQSISQLEGHSNTTVKITAK